MSTSSTPKSLLVTMGLTLVVVGFIGTAACVQLNTWVGRTFIKFEVPFEAAEKESGVFKTYIA